MLKSNQPVSVKGVAAIGAIVTLAALTGCVTRTKEVVVERPTQPATIVVQQPATAPANVRTMPGPINEQRGVACKRHAVCRREQANRIGIVAFDSVK